MKKEECTNKFRRKNSMEIQITNALYIAMTKDVDNEIYNNPEFNLETLTADTMYKLQVNIETKYRNKNIHSNNEGNKSTFIANYGYTAKEVGYSLIKREVTNSVTFPEKETLIRCIFGKGFYSYDNKEETKPVIKRLQEYISKFGYETFILNIKEINSNAYKLHLEAENAANMFKETYPDAVNIHKQTFISVYDRLNKNIITLCRGLGNREDEIKKYLDPNK